MSVKIKGIVLNEVSYSETSKILQVLTDEYGLISIISKGCKNIKNKLRGISNKLNYCNYDINYKENGISTLIDGNIINSFSNIYSDFKKCSYSFYVISLIRRVLNDNNDKNLFYLLEGFLNKVNDGVNLELLTLIVEIKLIDYLGLSINFDRCICGSDDIYSLSIENSSVVCKNCFCDRSFVSIKSINLFKVLYNIDINSIKSLDINDVNVFKEIDCFINEYYNKYTGIYLTSKDRIGKI